MVADPMNLWNDYYIARSIPDALDALAESQGTSQVIAGGTDLLLDLQQGRHDPVYRLVDVTEIPEMGRIEIKQGELFIGAAATHKKISQSELVRKHGYALAVASGMVGGPQVRNTATIGGNVAHGLPAADGTIALMALDAFAEVVSTSGARRLPLADLFLGPGKSTLQQGNQILKGFYIQLNQPAQASAFQRVMRPQGVAIAILNVAIWLQRNESTIEDIRIVMGPAGPVPRRLSVMESVLRGREICQETLSEARSMMLGETNFRTSRHRSTKTYRQEMASVLFENTLHRAYNLSQIG
jgi:CO/xanthine dehydrogenase FAD-binding subunit